MHRLVFSAKQSISIFTIIISMFTIISPFSPLSRSSRQNGKRCWPKSHKLSATLYVSQATCNRAAPQPYTVGAEEQLEPRCSMQTYHRHSCIRHSSHSYTRGKLLLISTPCRRCTGAIRLLAGWRKRPLNWALVLIRCSCLFVCLVLSTNG